MVLITIKYAMPNTTNTHSNTAPPFPVTVSVKNNSQLPDIIALNTINIEHQITYFIATTSATLNDNIAEYIDNDVKNRNA